MVWPRPKQSDRNGTEAQLVSLALPIERTLRYIWMLATHRRNELIEHGRGEDVNKLVEADRE